MKRTPALFCILFALLLAGVALGDGVGAIRRESARAGGGSHDSLNVGTATDASASGDFTAGLTGAARIFYDQSSNSGELTFYNSSGNAAMLLNGNGALSGIDGSSPTAITVSSGDGDSSNAGGALTVSAGWNTGTANGGALVAVGGASSGASGNGGAASLGGGASTNGTVGTATVYGSTVTLSTATGSTPTQTARWVVESGGDLVAQQSGDTVRAPGIARTLSSDTTPVTVTSTTAETDLMTYTLAAGLLASVGDRVIVEGGIVNSGAGNMDSMTIDFGSKTMNIAGGSFGENGDWTFRMVVVKTGTDTQYLQVEFNGPINEGADIDTTGAEDDGSTIAIAVRADPAATTKTITQSFMSVTYIPAP